MFRKVIVFGLFEIIQKKKKSEHRVPRFGFGLRVRSGTTVRAVTFLVVSEPSRRFYKMIFEIVYDMHCICI